MRRWRHRARGIWLAGWAGVWMGLLATPAAAQTTTYRCVTADGKRFTSSTPCSQARRPQTPIYYGPSQPPPVRALPPARLERAPEELTYMSPECATMREGIRTAPARGVDSRTQSELRRNFQELCTEDQSRARRALMEDKRLEQRERHQERQQVTERRTLAKADQDKLMAQCAEMRGAIRQRRARTGMSEGELRDLQLFEQRYETRCVNAQR
jgi:hypothetical protein